MVTIMFTLKFFLRRAFLALLCIGALCACGDNNGDEPEPPTPIEPNKDVPDPTGTISLSMRSKNGASSPTTLGNMYINEGDNFFTGYGTIIDLGAVKGLGNVSAIPKTGYANEIKVTPSHGYVYCDGYRNFYRVFVTDYIVDTGGGIIGADIKYQEPFYGKNEELKIKQESIPFTATGGETDVVFTNSSIIPFKIDSNQPWCKVGYASTLDHPCLTDAIHIAVASTEDTKESKAEITVTTLHGKTTKIAVTRRGVGPAAYFIDSSSSVDAPAGVYTIPIRTNMNLSELSVKSSESWAKVSLVANTTTNKERTRSIKWIGNEKAPQSQNSATAISTYYCRVEVDENGDSERRTAEITLSSKDGKISSKYTLSQKAYTIVITDDYGNSIDNIIHSADGGSLNIRVYSNTEVELSSSTSWASTSIDSKGTEFVRYSIKIDPNNTASKRTATITAKVKNSTKSSSFTIVQDAGYIDFSDKNDSYYDDKRGATHNLIIKGTLSFNVSTSDASWCTVYVSGNNLAITTSPTTQNRQAVVTITAGKESFNITVYQTKWATGDKNGDATVLLNKDKSFIYKVLSAQYAWSTQQIATGAVSQDDGVANTKKIHSIPNWQSSYPAFAAIEELNTNGESGWYMPAQEELSFNPSKSQTWSSTEFDYYNAYAYVYDNNYYSFWARKNKSDTKCVCAVKRFDAYKIE